MTSLPTPCVQVIWTASNVGSALANMGLIRRCIAETGKCRSVVRTYTVGLLNKPSKDAAKAKHTTIVVAAPGTDGANTVFSDVVPGLKAGGFIGGKADKKEDAKLKTLQKKSKTITTDCL